MRTEDDTPDSGVTISMRERGLYIAGRGTSTLDNSISTRDMARENRLH
jgi:hypothetical protein